MDERQERAVGQRLDHGRIKEQIDYALILAERDATILAECGWLVEDTKELRRLAERIGDLSLRFEGLYGGPRARDRRVAALIEHAKRWRLRALAVGRNGLESEARIELESYSRPTYSDPSLLASVLEGILTVLEANKEKVGHRGADEAFLVEGRKLWKGLTQAAAGKSVAGLYARLPKEAAELSKDIDQACGKAWKMLKKLNLSGRTAHLLRGDRQRAAEYHLDLLREGGEAAMETGD